MAESDQAIRDIVGQLAGSRPEAAPAMAALMTAPQAPVQRFGMMPVLEAARAQLATQPQRLAGVLPDVGEPAVSDGGRFSEGTAVGNKAADIGSKLGYGAMAGLATLPRRAIENSQESLNSGNYDPSVPVEAALTMMGGGVGGIEGEGAALGSGPSRMRMVDNVDLFKELANQKRGMGWAVGKAAPGWDFVRPQAENGSWADLLARTKAGWEGDKARAIGGFEDVAPKAIPSSPYMSPADWAFIAKNKGLGILLPTIGAAAYGAQDNPR